MSINCEICKIMDKTYTESYFLSAGESNAERELSLPLLVSKLIDIATAHANSLGIGNPSMENVNGGWVLSRLTIEMQSYPSVNSTYTISTWIESTNRHFSTRAFCISAEDGSVYGYARSIWMVMNTVDHTNVGLSHLNIPAEVIDGTVPPIATQSRHVPIVEQAEDTPAPAGSLVASAPAFDYRFEYCDLDFYRHVNTVRYVNLLLNRFSLEEHDATYVERLELSFLHEARYGMLTRVLRSDLGTPLHSAFQISRADDGVPLFFARVRRQPR